MVTPPGWSEVRLGVHFDANWGNTAVTKSSYVDSGHIAYSASGPDGFVSWYEHNGDGIVLSAIGALCGKTWLAQGKWTPIKNTIWIKSKSTTCSTRYLYHTTSNPKIWPSRGAAQPFIALGDVRDLRVSVPSLKEQEAIAEALGDADAAIDSLDALIAKKRDVKQAAMQQLLTGRSRLPGFTGEWEEVQFSQLCAPRKARIDPRVSGGGDVCIELENIASGSGHLLGITHTSNTSSLKTMFKSGDVLFGKLRAYLKKYWLADFAGVCSTEIWALEANKIQAVPEFLAQVVRMEDFIESASLSYGTHMPRSDWSIVSRLLVSVPSLKEQEAIGEALSAMDDELEALNEQVKKMRIVKEGMMQDLLTGKVRLV